MLLEWHNVDAHRAVGGAGLPKRCMRCRKRAPFSFSTEPDSKADDGMPLLVWNEGIGCWGYVFFHGDPVLIPYLSPPPYRDYTLPTTPSLKCSPEIPDTLRIGGDIQHRGGGGVYEFNTSVKGSARGRMIMIVSHATGSP